MQASARKAVPHHAACLLEAAEASPEHWAIWLGTARDRSACILTSAKGANLLNISTRKERPELADQGRGVPTHINLVECHRRSFRTIESVGYVVRVLRRCSHNGFPVVRGSPGDLSEDDEMEDSDSPGPDASRGSASREGPLEGVILRSQLMVLLANRVRCPPPLQPPCIHFLGDFSTLLVTFPHKC
jgi:hypothetical protein